MLSAIQVLRHVFTEFSVKAVTHAQNGSEIETLVDYEISAFEKEGADRTNLWEVTLSMRFERKDHESNETVDYRGHLSLVGHFMIHPDFPAEKREYLARMNGGAVLMGAAREAVVNQTLRSINGPMELPLVDARTFLPKEEQSTTLIPDRAER